MKITLITVTTAMVSSASIASAQSAWDGGYIGGSFATFTGENTYDNIDTPDGVFDLDGEMFGVFAGFNRAVNGYVIGGEISYMAGDVFEEEFEDEYYYDSFVDIKARAGFDAGQFLPYGVIGLTFGSFTVDEDARPALDEEITENGLLLGAGVDVAVGTQFTLGAEIATRSIAYEFENGLVDMDARVTSISLRGAYRF